MKNNFKEITIMNAFLCLCVIMIHITSAPITEFVCGTFWHTVIFIVNKLLCFSVPAFIFLSGFKLQNKYKDTKVNIKKFYLGRLKSIVIPYIISVIVYFLYFFSKQWVLLSSLPEYVFLGTLAAHFYYIVIAVQLYLLFPLIKWLFDKFPKTVLALSLICIILCLELFTFTYNDRFFGTYIFYFVFGMAFAKYDFLRQSKKLLITCSIAFVALAVFHMYRIYNSVYVGTPYSLVNIVNIIYVAAAIVMLYGVFTFLAKIPLVHNISRSLGKVSYNVYLYHILVISILQYDVFVTADFLPKDKFLITFAVVYGLTFLYAFLNEAIRKFFHK